MSARSIRTAMDVPRRTTRSCAAPRGMRTAGWSPRVAGSEGDPFLGEFVAHRHPRGARRRGRRRAGGRGSGRQPQRERRVVDVTRPTRGFLGRRQNRDPRLPPGQYDVGADWPVLTAEPTPRITPQDWTFTVDGHVESPTTWTWD